jgi:hypothetical protein
MSLGLQEFQVHRISRQSPHEGDMAISPTHRPPLPPEDIPVTHFFHRPSRLQGHGAVGRIDSLKNINDLTGNHAGDLPTFSAWSQQAPSPHARDAPYFYSRILKY